MEEKLAIMQWLYENGVEPRMIWSPTARVFEINGEANKPCEDSFMLWLPWIPLEQILEELRKRKEPIAMKVITVVGAKDIHLAALKLLKQVKEQSK